MHQRLDPSGDDRARQQHYLEYLQWRDEQLKAERAARREWWRREALIVVALVVGATSFIALLFAGQRELRRAAPALTASAPSTSVDSARSDVAIPHESAASVDSVAPSTRDPVTPAVERKVARPRPAARVSHTGRPGVSSQRRVAPSDGSSHAAASAAPAAPMPSSAISTPDAAPSPAGPSPTEVVAVVPAPAPTEVVAVVPEPSRTEVVVVAPPPSSAAASAARSECADVAAVMREDLTADGRTRKQRVADCVGGWLKGESREFRDGVSRQFGDFRDGVDTVGRGLQWLGSKLRRAD